MRILFLTRSMNYGGSERQLVALSVGLKEIGHRIIIAVFYSGGPLEKELEKSGVSVRGLDKRDRWDVTGFLFRLIRLIGREKPDIVHSYLVVSDIIATILKILFPRIKIVWGVRASNMDLGYYDWFSRLTYRMECLISHFPDRIIINSLSGFDNAIRQGFPRHKMVVIPNGIDTKRFRPDSTARKRLRAEWAVDENEGLIGIVARLDPMKDHSTFLRAAALIARERENVRFICVGGGPESYKRQLHRLADELGLKTHLVWAAERSDVHAVYNALDIASSSSSYGEGFPNMIGEAMACGVPCVVTDVGDSSWIVGNAGLIVPPKNPRALANGWRVMLERIGKSRLLLSKQTRSRIVAEFGVNKLVQKTSKILESLV